jgi:hypothetical protein
MDCVTRHNCSILGVNFQIIHDDILILKILAIIELKIKHTRENLKNYVFSLLKSYNITKKQIYTVTDNGVSMVKMVDLITNEHEEVTNEEKESEIEAHIVYFSNEMINIENKLDIHTGNKPNSSTSIRCSAHTLQLCVLSLLKTQIIQNQITRTRSTVKKLRTLNVLKYIKPLKLRKPIIDIPKRWNSTDDMLKSLIYLKAYYYDHTDIIDLNINDYDCDCFSKIVTSIEPAKIATIKLQDHKSTLGDFYGIWMQCLAETTKINSTISNALCIAMETRETVLLQNVVFLLGIFNYHC